MGILMLNGNNYTGGIQQVYGSSSGNIASFDDGGNDKPLKSLKVAINPVQDLHGYDRPWAGGAGKNKLNMVDVLPSGSYTGNTFNCLSFSNRPTVTLFSEPTTIIFSFKKATFGGSNGRIEFFNGSTLLSSKTLSGTNQSDTIQNVTAIKFNYSSGGALAVEEPMLRIATETDATFAPYSNICPISGWDEAEIHRADGATPHIIDDTYNITWSEAGTVYVATITIINGKVYLTKLGERVNLGDLTWTTAGSGRHNTTITRAEIVSNVQTTRAICEQYKATSATLIPSEDYSFCLGVNNVATLQINDSRYNNEPANDFKSHMNGVYLMYYYATPDEPIEIGDLTIDTLLGNNNIWSDTGDVLECVYQRDLNIVINQFDERITALEQALNSSGTRSLSLSKSAVKEEETEEITEEPKEEEQNEDKR